jgi:hypothetical protein
MKDETKKWIEEFVNSFELEMVADDAPWDEYIWPYIERRIKERTVPDCPTADQMHTLYQDLRDWWKNGNMYHWGEGEHNNFGMGRWRMGDEDFLYEG